MQFTRTHLYTHSQVLIDALTYIYTYIYIYIYIYIYLNKCNDEVPISLELWGVRSSPSLAPLPGPLWPGMVAPDRILSIGPIELKYILVLN